MKVYKIPFDVKHEEKIFGGYLSLRQVLYLFLIILSGGIFLIDIILYAKILVFSILSIIFLLFAFVKVESTRIDKYLFYIVRFFFRKKKYMFER